MTEHFKKFFSLGFFPEELPPEFGPYGITYEVADDLWGKIDNICNDNIPTYPTHLSFPKSEYVRRDFHFLNPCRFARLSHTILENWDEIKGHTDKSKFSTSNLDLSESDSQIFQHDPFSKSINERISKSTSKQYVLYIDIENFYPSIYTHSIDWALNQGNKRHHSQFNNREHLGIALDQDARRAQHNETNGIVVGVVTSRVISEIISCYFDQILTNQFQDIEGIRYVDDYHIFLSSREEIEKVQVALQKVLSHFKLKFNETKISVDSLPEVYSDYWTIYFDDHESLIRHGFGNKKELIRRFSKAFELIKANPENPSLRYFFRVLEDHEILKKFELKVVIELIHHSLKSDPRSISRACLALSKNGLINEDLHEHLEQFEPTLVRLSDLSYSFEVVWILYLFLHGNRSIPSKVVENIISSGDITCISYLFLCWNRGLVKDEEMDLIKIHIIEKSEKFENIWKSPLWILAYEDQRQGWDLFEEIEIPNEFQIFLDHGIEFLKGEPNDNPDDIRISRYEIEINDNEPPF